MHPWLEWNKEQLLDGDLPVWNPYNGAGTPHLANFVSAVLSPVQRALLRAAVAGGAARRRPGSSCSSSGCSPTCSCARSRCPTSAGLVGAAGFMFAAYNVLWLAWPHPGGGHLPARRAVLRRGGHAGREPGAAAAGLVRLRAGRPGRLPGRAPGDPVLRWGLVLAYVPVRLLLSPGAGRRAGAAGQGGPVRGGQRAGGGAGRRCSCCPSSSTSTAAPPTPRAASGPRPTSTLGLLGAARLPRPVRGAQPDATTSRCSWSAACSCPTAPGCRPTTSSPSASTSACWCCSWPGWGRCRSLAAGGSFVGLFLAVAAVVWVVYVHDLGGIGHTVGHAAPGRAERHQPQPPRSGPSPCAAWPPSGSTRCCRAGAGRWTAGGRRRAVAAGGMLAAGGGGAPGPAHAGRGRQPRRDAWSTRSAGPRSTPTCGSSPSPSWPGWRRWSALVGLAAGGVGGCGRWPGWRWWAWCSPRAGGCSATTTRPSTSDLVYADSPGAGRGGGRRRAGRGDGVAGRPAVGRRQPLVPAPVPRLLRRGGRLPLRAAADATWPPCPTPLRGARTLEVLGIRYVAAEQAPTRRPCRRPGCRRRRRSPPPSTACTRSPSAPPAAAGGRRELPGHPRAGRHRVGGGGGPGRRRRAASRTPPSRSRPSPTARAATYTARFGGQVEVLAFVPWALGTSGLEQVDGNDQVALFRAPGQPGPLLLPGRGPAGGERRRGPPPPGVARLRHGPHRPGRTTRRRAGHVGHRRDRSRCSSNGRPRCGCG